MMNITLLEMLRQNFGITVSGLDPLPTDESGVNVKLIYSIIRNSIKNQRKWHQSAKPEKVSRLRQKFTYHVPVNWKLLGDECF